VFRFIGEETVSHYDLPALTDAPTWIIDPIDGTTNFIHSFPHICISVALTVNKELQIGIIYNPILQQLFTAKRGQGAFLNERPITSSNVEGKSFNILIKLNILP
jgi:myo-inositol-1(or 4)-monophosphatase